MASGRGRLLQHLYKEIDSGRLEAEIGAVICSRHCNAEEIGRLHNAEVFVIPGSPFCITMECLIRDYRIDLIALAGYTRKVILPPQYYSKCINIHPSLLPKYGGEGMYGRRVHRAVLDAGEKETGCTVHLVDEEYDHGEHLIQRVCPVKPGDTPETLAARVFELEKTAYVEAIQSLLLQV
tara:strand:+ start:201008 stop:201547 length:540 start_codon:yes stop_codon:yes gene_type:complete